MPTKRTPNGFQPIMQIQNSLNASKLVWICDISSNNGLDVVENGGAEILPKKITSLVKLYITYHVQQIDN